MNPTNEIIFILLIVIFAITMLYFIFLGILSKSQARKAQKAIVENQIANLHDQLNRCQIEYPQFMYLSRKWTPETIKKVYKQNSDEDRQWAKYYVYNELYIGYSNTVLHALRNKLISNNLFKNQHEPVIRKWLAIHHPIVNDLLHDGRHNSVYLTRFIKNKEN
jgi:hypothetical protein